ncbi:hypothetical protein ACE1SV_22040 [Streptomyces sennicomposti]
MTVHRADITGVTSTGPEHVPLAVETVSARWRRARTERWRLVARESGGRPQPADRAGEAATTSYCASTEAETLRPPHPESNRLLDRKRLHDADRHGAQKASLLY